MADIKHNFAARVASTKIFSASLDSWLDTTSSISSFVLAESPLTVVSVSGPRSSLCRCRRCKKLSRFDRFVLALLRASGRPPSGRGDGSHRNADKVAGIGRREPPPPASWARAVPKEALREPTHAVRTERLVSSFVAWAATTFFQKRAAGR